MRVTAAALAVAGLAVGSGAAGATPSALGSKHDRLVTDDGWTISLEASELTVNPMSNLANSASSREGWISSKVQGRISGRGTEAVQSAILEHFLVVGCQVDVSDGATLGLGLQVGPTANVTISGQPSGTIGIGAQVSPSITMPLKPGRITEISLGKKRLQTDRASVRVKRARVSVDGCMGPTTVRIIARLSVSTRTADDTINVYSARHWL
ncbi:MspA family porin [Gordonia neofelifaecis]|uniref:Membrane protein n=1 Tax=Gordonia neofelifaecis NRRL B-59395 TaxID=644548 RepID=F1YNM2_9ACTN|nr:MspA family porin [Gordonia neofelifaecis]EGD53632.1 membrane protein [Gordonia neofelifaecis NRRL B-59395]